MGAELPATCGKEVKKNADEICAICSYGWRMDFGFYGSTAADARRCRAPHPPVAVEHMAIIHTFNSDSEAAEPPSKPGESDPARP